MQLDDQGGSLVPWHSNEQFEGAGYSSQHHNPVRLDVDKLFTLAALLALDVRLSQWTVRELSDKPKID